LKKSLIIFAVAFAVSLVLILLSSLGGIMVSIYASPSLVYANNALSLLYLVISVFASFAMFYYLGRKAKIKVVKSVTLALFFGLLVGVLVSNLILVMSLTLIFGARYTGFSWVTYVEGYAFDSSGLLSAVFELFFPALVGLLFVELRERNSHNDLSP